MTMADEVNYLQSAYSLRSISVSWLLDFVDVKGVVMATFVF